MTIWLERLTVPKLMLITLNKIIIPKTDVCYPAISSLSNLLLNWFKGIGLFKWVRFQELLVGVQTEIGENLRYRVEELTDIVVSKVFNRLFSGQNYIPAYLRDYTPHIHLAFKSYLLHHFFRQKICFLCAIDYLYRTNPSYKNKKPQYWLNYFPLFSEFNKAVFPYVKGKLHIWPSPISIVKELLPAKVLYSLFGFIALSFIPRQKCKKKYMDLIKDSRSKILVEFHRPSSVNDECIHLFWLSKSDIPADRVIMGFDRNDSPCSDENIEFVETRNMCWLDLKLTTLNLYVSQPFRLLIHNFIHTPIPRRLTESAIWRWKTMHEFGYFLQIWREIIKRYKIKVFHQHQEHTFWSHIQSLATKIEGGFYFWFHWSLDRFPVAHVNAGYCDVFFSWGKLGRDYIDMHKFRYRYMLDIGLVFDHTYDLEEKMRSFPMGRTNEKVDFIITLFGTSFGSWKQCSPQMEGYFYESALQTIREHPTWATIIKPKIDNYLAGIHNKKKIEGLIETLCSENRCVSLPARYAPFIAARMADVCLCHTVNSAGAIASLCGRRVIHWDLIGNIRHPFYLDTKGCFVFKTKKEVIGALESLAQNKDNHYFIGDHSSWFNILDPYRDGKAGLRAGQFIKSFLDYTDEGNDGDTALQKAVKKFAERWGKDKVYSFETKDDRLDDNIWVKAERTLRK